MGYSFQAFGARLGIRSNDPEALEGSLRVLSADWKVLPAGPSESLYSLFLGQPPTSTRQRHYHLLYENELRRARTLNPAELLETLRQALPWSVARLARGKLFLQAAALAWRGQALVLPGEGGGRSTLVRALEAAGARVYSRTHAVLDRQGRIHPFRDPGEGGRLPPLPLGLVLVTRYRPGARFAPRRLPPGPAALEITRHLLPIYHWPTEVSRRLPGLVASVPVLKGPRPEADSLLTWLDRI